MKQNKNYKKLSLNLGCRQKLHLLIFFFLAMATYANLNEAKPIAFVSDSFRLSMAEQSIILEFPVVMAARLEINFLSGKKNISEASIVAWPVNTAQLQLPITADISTADNIEINLIQHEYIKNRILERFGSGAGQFREATAIYLDPWNNLFVVDAISDQIVVFSHNFDFIRNFGSFSIQPTAAQKGDIYRLESSSFDQPLSITAGNNLNYFVVDSRNKRVVELDANGSFLKEIRPPDGFDEPGKILINSRNEIAVLDPEKDRISFFNTLGFHLFNIGSYGRSADRLNRPTDFAMDEQDNIYILDRGNKTLKKFARSTRFLGNYKPKQFPQGIAIDPFGFINLINDRGISTLNPELQKTNHNIFPQLSEKIRLLCFSHRKQAFTVSGKNSVITEWLPKTKVNKQIIPIQ